MAHWRKGWQLLVWSTMLIAHTSFGQLRIYDSLKIILGKNPSPEQRIDLLNEMAYSLYDFNDTVAFTHAKDAVLEAQKLNYTKGLKQAYVMVGLGYFSQGAFRETVDYYNRALRLKAEGDAKTEAYIYQMLGKLHFELANYDSALFYDSKALNVPGLKEDKAALANVFRNIAQVHLIKWQNAEALDYLNRAEQLLRESGNDAYVMTEIWSLMGTYYENTLNFDQSTIYFDKMCELANRDKDYFHLIKCQLNQSDLAFRQGNFSEALKYAAAALEMSEKYSYPPQLVDIYLKFGEIYAELSQHEIATKYLFEGLKISEKIGFRNSTGKIYSDLAWIYYERNNLDQAFEYINRSMALRREIDDQRGLGNCYNVRGLLLLNQEKLNESMAEFEKARAVWAAIDHQEGIAAILFNEGLIYVRKGQYQKALDNQLDAIEIEKKVDNAKNLGTSYNHLANLYIKMGRLTEAERYLALASQLAEESQSLIQQRTNYQFYAQLYEAKGDYKKAYEAQQKFAVLNDSIYQVTGAVKLAEMEALYRMEQKDQKIRLLSQQAQLRDNDIALKEAQLRQQRSITTAALVGIVLISALAFTTYRFNRSIRKAHRSILEQKEEIQAQAEELTESNSLLSKLNRDVTEKNEEIQAQSEELIEANQTISQINKTLEEKVEARTADLKQAYKELDTFFYRSSHDFRRPITTFLGLAEVAKITVKDANALELFEKVQETASNLDKMLVKLQSISDVGAQHLIFKEVLTEGLLHDLEETFQSEITRKGITVESRIELTEPFHSYPALVKIILENLFENAIFFCGAESPRITIAIRNQKDRVVLTMADNGQGIDETVQSKIFEMYFRGNERSKGNGLGLYIVKKAVDKLHGEISFETEVHVGTTFRVVLPNQFT